MNILPNWNDDHFNKNLKFPNSLWIQEGKISHTSLHFQTPKKPVKISYDSKLVIKILTPNCFKWARNDQLLDISGIISYTRLAFSLSSSVYFWRKLIPKYLHLFQSWQMFAAQHTRMSSPGSTRPAGRYHFPAHELLASCIINTSPSSLIRAPTTM